MFVNSHSQDFVEESEFKSLFLISSFW